MSEEQMPQIGKDPEVRSDPRYFSSQSFSKLKFSQRKLTIDPMNIQFAMSKDSRTCEGGKRELSKFGGTGCSTAASKHECWQGSPARGRPAWHMGGCKGRSQGSGAYNQASESRNERFYRETLLNNNSVLLHSSSYY